MTDKEELKAELGELREKVARLEGEVAAYRSTYSLPCRYNKKPAPAYNLTIACG